MYQPPCCNLKGLAQIIMTDGESSCHSPFTVNQGHFEQASRRCHDPGQHHHLRMQKAELSVTESAKPLQFDTLLIFPADSHG